MTSSDHESIKSIVDSIMLLKPKDATLFDFLRVLIPWLNPVLSDLKFLEINGDDHRDQESFNYRWLIFLTIIGHKFIHLIFPPIAWSGKRLETLINLDVHRNGGLLMLIPNFLRGKLIWPDRESAEFVSCIGKLDTRVKLDALINRVDYNYYFALSMMASKTSYENAASVEKTVEDDWKMKFVGFYDCWNEYQEKDTTQVMVFLDGDTYVVAFRGTEPFDEDAWFTDIDMSWCVISGVGKMHIGFLRALGLQNNGWPQKIKRDKHLPHQPAYYLIRDILKNVLSENKEAKFIVTGHSLGGALAILFGTILFYHDDKFLLERLDGIYTFGQPRVGDANYVNYMNQKLKEHKIKYYRFVYCNDIVPRLPYADTQMMYKHFGKCIFFNRHYEAKILEGEDPIKDYYSLLSKITKRWNAIMEMIRSFTIAKKYGPNYREGWFLFLFRTIFGLLEPGVPAHGPQDYLNSTLLGSFEEYVKLD